MKYVYNDPHLKYTRKKLRITQTESERILWLHLRSRRLAGYRFIRQYSVDRYILDFYCPKARLGIELDGSQHAEEEIVKYDSIRTIHLTYRHIRVIRFWNSEVNRDLDKVLETIYYHLTV